MSPTKSKPSGELRLAGLMTQALTITTKPQADAGLEAIKAIVLDSLTSVHSKSSYNIALSAFLPFLRDEWRGPFNRAAVNAYKAKLLASGLSPATCNARLAAIRKLASEASENGLLSNELASGIIRIRGVARHGVRVGNWLSREQAQALLDAPDPSTFVGKRDRALLAVLLGAGLRREETCHLTLEHLQQRDGRWCVVDIIGKGGRIRTVPIGDWVKFSIDEWAAAAGISTGIVFRIAYSRRFDYHAARTMRAAGQRWTAIAATLGVSVTSVIRASKSGPGSRLLPDKPLTPQAIFKAVRRHAAAIGLHLAPHDLRRTFAKLARRGGSPIEQIQRSLGHGSPLTTDRYLGTEQDLQDAPADRLGLGTSR